MVQKEDFFNIFGSKYVIIIILALFLPKLML